MAQPQLEQLNKGTVVTCQQSAAMAGFAGMSLHGQQGPQQRHSPVCRAWCEQYCRFCRGGWAHEMPLLATVTGEHSWEAEDSAHTHTVPLSAPAHTRLAASRCRHDIPCPA